MLSKQSFNQKKYPNIDKAVAFRINFHQFVFTYDDIGWYDYNEELCSRCGFSVQTGDFLAPKSNCAKKDYAILDTYHFGVSIEVKELLIDNFDISEEDFRPIRNKVGEIVFYQITPQHIMLPMHETKRYKELKPCKKCGRTQYRLKQYENRQGYPYGYITSKALAEMHDINETFEKCELYLPEWIVSKRVYEFLTERYPRMQFVPLFIKDI